MVSDRTMSEVVPRPESALTVQVNVPLDPGAMESGLAGAQVMLMSSAPSAAVPALIVAVPLGVLEQPESSPHGNAVTVEDTIGRPATALAGDRREIVNVNPVVRIPAGTVSVVGAVTHPVVRLPAESRICQPAADPGADVNGAPILNSVPVSRNPLV